MDHFDEHTLELYVLGSPTLTPAVRESISLHLDLCAGCRALVSTFQSFYREFHMRLDVTESRDLDIFMQRLYPSPHIIVLRPFRAHSHVAVDEHAHVTVLAATTPPAGGARPRFETLATLASEKDRSLARIHHDRVTGKYKLYYHTEDPSKREGAIVSFPDLQADFVLDNNGQVEFSLSPDRVPPDWSTLAALIRLPVFAARAAKEDLEGSGECVLLPAGPQDPFRVNLSFEHHHLSLESHSPDAQQQPTRALLKGSGGESILFGLSEGKGTVALDALPSQFHVSLYL